MIQLVQWLDYLIQYLVSELLLGLILMIGVCPVWKYDEKWPTGSNVLSQVDPVWNTMKHVPKEVLRAISFSEGVKASFEG